MKTNYTQQIEQSGLITILKENKVASKGFLTESDALHSIWVLEGKVSEHFYVSDGLEICREVREDDI